MLTLAEGGRPALAEGKLSAAGDTASDHRRGLNNRDPPEPVLNMDHLHDASGTQSMPCHSDYKKGV